MPSRPTPQLPGRAWVGCSGFAYRGWIPRFYPPGTRTDEMLQRYAARLTICELNNTFYRHPTRERIESWIGDVPADFRFTVKAHRTASMRAFDTDPDGVLPWLLAPFEHFGERLGAVLWRVPATRPRDDARLEAFLAAWPPSIPIALEFQHASWHEPAVRDRLAAAGAAFCVTDLDDPSEPELEATARFVYLRLRRDAYTDEALERWADRLARDLAAGRAAYVFFRHDPDGLAPDRALDLTKRIERLRGEALDPG